MSRDQVLGNSRKERLRGSSFPTTLTKVAAATPTASSAKTKNVGRCGHRTRQKD